MIPKIIHYCWFGHGPKKELNQKCINSWKKYCGDWKLIEWNEDNFDFSSAPLYVKQAYKAKKWSKVSDYVRLKVVYEHGGIYLDTDVEIIKDITPLLQYDAYFGLLDSQMINTGCGFGAIKGMQILKELMQNYENMAFIKQNGSYDKTPCPLVDTGVFLRHGMKKEDTLQVLEPNIAILPTEFVNPFQYLTCELHCTDKTYSIHWCEGSWWSKRELRLYSVRIYFYRLKKKIYRALAKIKVLVKIKKQFSKRKK